MLAELQRATPAESGSLGGKVTQSSMSKDATRLESPKSEYATTLEQVGISRQTAKRYESRSVSFLLTVKNERQSSIGSSFGMGSNLKSG